MAVTTREGMIRLAGDEFSMGSARFYPEERPPRRIAVDPFWIDETLVTNAAFGRFVAATGYPTLAERCAQNLPVAGSAVFVMPDTPVAMDDPSAWWSMREGACWRRPLGAESDLAGLADHPVVHVALADALAYAAWAGKTLPTEAEWEFAARGGLDGADYAWGNALAPEGLMLANYWQGTFPTENLLTDGWARTSPVRSFPANAYGLFDLIGNVWEWTADDWSLPREMAEPKACCSSRRPSTVPADWRAVPEMLKVMKVLKGGSHLCALNYCQRFRPAARHPQPASETTSHIGFRCVLRNG